jgi:GNAT superfamily N-acetyltransferase
MADCLCEVSGNSAKTSGLAVTAVPSGGRLGGMHQDARFPHDRRPVDAPPRTEIAVVPAAGAGDAGLAAELTDLVNRVYAVAEEGLWVGGATRTTPAEIQAMIAAGEIVVARRDGRLVGAVRVQRLDHGDGEFGMLVAAPEQRGTGLGRDLVAFAERWARERGLARMQLELLVPRTWSHPVKEFLRGWYTRIGYRVVRTGSLGEAYPTLVPQLATPCDFLIFHKDLRAEALAGSVD